VVIGPDSDREPNVKNIVVYIKGINSATYLPGVPQLCGLGETVQDRPWGDLYLSSLFLFSNIFIRRSSYQILYTYYSNLNVTDIMHYLVPVLSITGNVFPRPSPPSLPSYCLPYYPIFLLSFHWNPSGSTKLMNDEYNKHVYQQRCKALTPISQLTPDELVLGSRMFSYKFYTQCLQTWNQLL